jgi:hypothetical protein
MNSLETGDFDFIRGGRGVNERVRVLPIQVVLRAKRGGRDPLKKILGLIRLDWAGLGLIGFSMVKRCGVWVASHRDTNG